MREKYPDHIIPVEPQKRRGGDFLFYHQYWSCSSNTSERLERARGDSGNDRTRPFKKGDMMKKNIIDHAVDNGLVVSKDVLIASFYVIGSVTASILLCSVFFLLLKFGVITTEKGDIYDKIYKFDVK